MFLRGERLAMAALLLFGCDSEPSGQMETASGEPGSSYTRSEVGGIHGGSGSMHSTAGESAGEGLSGAPDLMAGQQMGVGGFLASGAGHTGSHLGGIPAAGASIGGMEFGGISMTAGAIPQGGSPTAGGGGLMSAGTANVGGNSEAGMVAGGSPLPGGAGGGGETSIGETPDEQAPQWEDDAQLTVERAGLFRARILWPMAVDESDVVGYSVFQNGVLIAAVPGDVAEVRVGPLQPVQRYDFQVQAEDEFGNISEDGPTGFIQLSDRIAPAFGASPMLDVSQTGPNQATLNWSLANDDVGVTQYQVYRDHQLISQLDAPIQTYVVDDLIEGVEYLFRIEAFDEAGNRSNNGPMRALVVQDRTPPTWSADARVWGTNLMEQQLRLNWDQPVDQVGVTLYRINQSGVEVALIRPPQRWVVLEGLRPFTAYDFEVVAEDTAGNRSVSPLSTTITTPDQTAPTWSLNAALVVRSTNGTSVTLGWSGAEDRGQLANYTLYQDNIEVATVPADRTEYTVMGLSTLTEYVFRVEAIDAAGNRSDTGPSFRVSLNDGQPPVWAPDAIMTVLETTPTTARVTWSAATDDVGISGYEITVDGQLATTTGADGRTVTLNSLAPNRALTVSVIALDGAGNRAQGPTVQVNTPDYVQPQWPAEAVVNAENITTNRVDLTWTAVPNAPNMAGYVVYLDDVEVGRVDFQINTFTAQNLPPNTDLIFRIEVVGPTGRMSQGGPIIQVTTLDLDAPVWPVDAALEASLVTETGVTLTWTALVPEEMVQRYVVYQDDVIIGTTQPPQRMMVVNNLQAITAYTFKIEVAGLTERVSMNGPMTVVNTIDSTNPTWPQDAQLITGRVGRDAVELSWTDANDNVGVIEYRVETDTGLSWNTNMASVTADQLMPETQYNFSVLAVDGAGNESNDALTLSVRTPAAAALTDQEVYDGLRPDCAACHGPGSQSPYFGSFQEFQELVIQNASLVTFGEPDDSIFIRVMEGNGDAPWSSMPLGARNYRQMSLRGDTAFNMEQLKAWVRAMGGN